MAFDLAEVLEKTRKLKRKLCDPPYNISTDVVFSGDFLDPDHMEGLRQKVSSVTIEGSGLANCLCEMDQIIEGLRAGLERPSDCELCRRYADKKIEARTVQHITGWSPVELYNKCIEYGYQAPSFGD
jgi:hypothetical protein